MARKPATPASIERSPALSAIEQLGRLIQTGTPVARVTRTAQGIASRWRATAGADAALEWITTLHADLVSGAAEAEEQVGVSVGWWPPCEGEAGLVCLAVWKA